MRIRSIRPEFWTSTAISSLALEDRLLFIGLWSYVDDNGVGIDRLSLIATELFPDDIEKEPRETFARVSRGLASLSEAGRITRYSVDGKDYLSVTNWTEHQKIDKPGRARYPLPTSTDAHIRDTLANVSRDPIEASPTGEGEKGRRGEGEKPSSSPTADAAEDREDVQSLCQHLADRIVANGSKQPNIGKGWIDAARLLLDRDARDLDEAHRLIDWCQDDSFWRTNILSMPKFREKYDALRLKAGAAVVAGDAGDDLPPEWKERPKTDPYEGVDLTNWSPDDA